MKRFFAIIAAALMLASMLCACSGTATITDDPYNGYGNVSTTDDGTVNGTNDYLYGTNRGTSGMTNGRGTNGMTNGAGSNGTYDGSNPSGRTAGETNRGMTNGSANGSTSSMSRGTGNGSSTGYGTSGGTASAQ